MFIPIGTWRMNAYVSDKWQLTRQLTLNLGVRYDYDDNSSNTTKGFAPRLGVAYSPDEKTVLRAGFGKFYEFPPTSIISDLFAGKVISSVFTFDTGEDLSATRGVLRPIRVCSRPGAAGPGEDHPGMPGTARHRAEPARRRQLHQHRAAAVRQPQAWLSVSAGLRR